jgi:hypothetical protein
MGTGRISATVRVGQPVSADNMNGVENKFTSLRDEIRYVGNTSPSIAPLRDENVLTIDIEDSLLVGRCPTVPLHRGGKTPGARGNEKSRSIRISARRDGERLILSVTVNGGTISAGDRRDHKPASTRPGT